MMKTTTTLAIVYLAGFISAYCNPEALDKMLDERITANKELTKQFIAEAEETTLKDKLVPLEKEIGAGWVNYLKYVRASKDTKLKAMVLRLEYLQTIADAYYDLEYEEEEAKKPEHKKKLESSIEDLKKLEKIVNQPEPSKD